MRHFVLVSAVAWLGAFAIAGHMSREVESSNLVDQIAERNAQLCQLDARYCKS